jgi:hypothetical protein
MIRWRVGQRPDVVSEQPKLAEQFQSLSQE